MWLVQLPSGLREAWGWPKRVDNPFFRCAPPPQLRGRGGPVLLRGRGLARGVGPFRRPAGRFCGAFRSARAVGAGVWARAASRLRPRGSRGVLCWGVRPCSCWGGQGWLCPLGGLPLFLLGGLSLAGAMLLFWGLLLQRVLLFRPGCLFWGRLSLLGLFCPGGGAPVASGSVSPGGSASLGAPVASGSVLSGGSAADPVLGPSVVESAPSFGGGGRRAPRFGSRRFSSRGFSLRRRSSPESAVSPRPPSPAPAQEAFWTFCSPFPASEGPRELPFANVDLTAHSFEPALVSEDEEFAREVDSKLLYTD